ncbi:hypothetical protein ES705_37611 [subsurface metagenome]
MPLIVRCKECGHILHSGGLLTMRYGLRSIPQQVSEMHEGKCPNCDRDLPLKAKVVGVSPANELTPELEPSPKRKKKRGKRTSGKRTNIGKKILTLLREHKGEIGRSEFRKHFDNYSKGHLNKCLRALKYKGLMVEFGGKGPYVLTRQGWDVVISEFTFLWMKDLGGRRMNLDVTIIALLKEYTGRVSRDKMWERFNNYSKGYLYERLLALKRSG